MEYPASRPSPTERGVQRTGGSSSPIAQLGSLQSRSGLPSPNTPAPRGIPDVRGRHRKRAELLRLNQEIQLLKEELDALEGLPPASKSCKELLQFTETCPDPLLPITTGPMNPQWDRWFEPPQEGSEVCGCWKS